MLSRHCADVGRDPAEIQRSVGAPNGEPAGSAAPLLAAGATLFTVGLGGPDYDLTQLKSWIAWRDSL